MSPAEPCGAVGAGGAPTWLTRWGVIAVPTLLAGVLAAIELDARSIWLDEAATVSITSQHGAALGSAMARDGGNMLGYYAVIHLLVGWFGSGLLVLRLPSVIACAVTTSLVVVIAERLFSRRVALAAGLLSAVSLPSVYWAQDARSYALMMTFVAASYLAFLVLIDPRSAGPVSRAAWVGYVVATTLALYMSFVAVLVVPAQLAALVCNRRRFRPVVSAVVLVALLCSPLAVLAVSRGTGQLFWVPRPDLQAFGQVLVSLASAGFQPNFHLTATSVLLATVTVVACCLALVFVVARVVREGTAARVWGEFYVVGWLVVPLALSFVESRVAQPTFTARNLLVSTPAAAIVLARVVADRRLPRLAGAGLLAGFVGLRAAQLAPSYGVSPENWRAATSYILRHAAPGDCIAFYPQDGKMGFTYYLDHDAKATATLPRPVLPTTPLRKVLPYVERYGMLDRKQLVRVSASCTRLWLVSSHEGSPTGTATSRAHYATYLRLAGDVETLYPESSVFTFGWASPIAVWLYWR
jgi:mannosyltransferase